MGMMARLTAVVALMLLGGCYSHNFPVARSFPLGTVEAPLPSYVRQVSVDANGTFYPDGWPGFGLPRSPWPQHSLLNQLQRDPRAMDMLSREEERQLGELEEFARGKRRVFILVHGFNATPAESERPFEQVETLIRPGFDDAVIRFHWDGLRGSGIGAGRIWFNAVGYSQLAGTRGLRRILARLHGQQVYLIAHSRGASVVLSALSNPPFDPAFETATREVVEGWGWRPDRVDAFLAPDPLPDNGNSYHLLFAAPAIDIVDFCAPAVRPTIDNEQCHEYRTFGPSVQSLRFTVNRRDPVLNKFVGLGAYFNPTRLGLRMEVAERLASIYPWICAYEFTQPMRAHGFSSYVQHERFRRQLADAGLIAGEAPQPCSNQPS